MKISAWWYLQLVFIPGDNLVLGYTRKYFFQVKMFHLLWFPLPLNWALYPNGYVLRNPEWILEDELAIEWNITKICLPYQPSNLFIYLYFSLIEFSLYPQKSSNTNKQFTRASQYLILSFQYWFSLSFFLGDIQ